MIFFFNELKCVCPASFENKNISSIHILFVNTLPNVFLFTLKKLLLFRLVGVHDYPTHLLGRKGFIVVSSICGPERVETAVIKNSQQSLHEITLL
jgi:hypothetical protein